MLFIVLLGWGFSGAARGESMFVNPQKLKEFKARIGFDKIVDSPDPDVGVIADWDGAKEYLPTPEAGWKTFSDDIATLSGGLVMRKWVFQRGDATLVLKIHVSSVGAGAVRDRFLSDVTTTSMMEIPYVRGPAYLGQLSVQMPGTPLQTVFWVFHNVYVELSDTSGISVDPMARSIQGFMERHVSQHVSQELPRIDKVKVSKSQPQVEEEVEVQVHSKQSRPQKPFRVHIQFRPDEFRLTKQSETSATYRALRSGKATVEAWLSDLKLLLVTQVQVQVDIQPKR